MSNVLAQVCATQYLGHTYTKKGFTIYPQLEFNWSRAFYLATLILRSRADFQVLGDDLGRSS